MQHSELNICGSPVLLFYSVWLSVCGCARLRRGICLTDNLLSIHEGDLKRICETGLGIVSQCCLTKNVFNMRKQYLASVALKINVKVGGRNTVLVDTLSRRIPLVTDRPTIIFGADVTHHRGGFPGPSIAAVRCKLLMNIFFVLGLKFSSVYIFCCLCWLH